MLPSVILKSKLEMWLNEKLSHLIMSSTNTANVIERVLNSKTIFNYLYRVKGPYVVLSFLLLLFCVLCGVIVNSVLKSRFSIISASGFRKRQKQRTNMARCSSPSSGRNTELKQTLIYISALSLQRSFGGKSSWARIWSHLLCLCATQFGECDSLTNPVCAVAEPGAHAEN